MCFGGGNKSGPMADATTADLLAREGTREGNIMLGKANIDKNFKQFDDAYYDEYKDTYKSNYIPQVEEQYTSAVGKMLAALAARGMDRSSVGGAKQGELAEDFVDAKTTIASEADTAANNLRSNVESSKSNLYALNSASADPAAASQMALGQSKSLVAPPQYSPLGDVFASALQPFNNFQASQNNTPSRTYKSPFNSGNRAGSSRVVK